MQKIYGEVEYGTFGMCNNLLEIKYINLLRFGVMLPEAFCFTVLIVVCLIQRRVHTKRPDLRRLLEFVSYIHTGILKADVSSVSPS